MVLLGGIKRIERLELGHNRIVPDLLGFELGDHAFGGGFLLGGVVIDCRSILRTHIGPLLIEGRGIVNSEKDVQQIRVRDHVGIERHLHHFRVSRAPGAHLLVGGSRDMAARVPGLHTLHAAQFLERRLETPEAAARERGDFVFAHRCKVAWNAGGVKG